jgi:hypothetical protein
MITWWTLEDWTMDTSWGEPVKYDTREAVMSVYINRRRYGHTVRVTEYTKRVLEEKISLI